MKMQRLAVTIAVMIGGCGKSSMAIEFAPEDLKKDLKDIDFPLQDKTSYNQLMDYLERRRLSFEIDRHDKSIPCLPTTSKEVHEVIQIYRLLGDSSIIRIAIDDKKKILCVARLEQHRGM